MAKVDSLHWELEIVRNQTGKQKKLRDIEKMILIENLKEEWMEKIELQKRYYMRKREEGK